MRRPEGIEDVFKVLIVEEPVREGGGALTCVADAHMSGWAAHANSKLR